VIYEPEFMTSVQASRITGENDMLDASAAALILQSYLDKQVKDLEYGTLGKSPSHFIKKAEAMIDNEISGALSDITVDFMLTRGLPG
jgi:hypothetical protein